MAAGPVHVGRSEGRGEVVAVRYRVPQAFHVERIHSGPVEQYAHPRRQARHYAGRGAAVDQIWHRRHGWREISYEAGVAAYAPAQAHRVVGRYYDVPAVGRGIEGRPDSRAVRAAGGAAGNVVYGAIRESHVVSGSRVDPAYLRGQVPKARELDRLPYALLRVEEVGGVVQRY